MKKIVILYAPVLHGGYVHFLKSHENDTVYLVSDNILLTLEKEIPYYGRNVSGMQSSYAFLAYQALKINNDIRILDEAGITEVRKGVEAGATLTMPDEDISHDIAVMFFPELLHLNKITFENIFLRWNKKISTKEFEVAPDRVISTEDFDQIMMRKAFEEGMKSPDWWRRVGAVLVKDKKVLITAFNTHEPQKDNPNVLGDPRSNFNAGESIEVSTAIHAEAALIAEAARYGNSLEGAQIYVSTFPCPNCARLIVRSGIKKIFYADGYSLVDAEDILKIAGVEIVMVKTA